LGIVLSITGTLSVPRLAGGHTPGLSAAEFQVTPSGPVEARLTFANAEPLGPSHALRDADLRAFVLDGIDVTADAARCEGAYRGASVTEGDGLLLEAVYDCAPGATMLQVTLYYLSALPAGHREIARILGPPDRYASIEGVLTGDRRALTLLLPTDPARVRRERTGSRIMWLTAVFAAVMVSLVVWRWRATRKSR
jgi:hypothetical protein